MFRPTLRVWHSLLLLIACGGSVAKTSEPGAAGAAGTMAGSAPAGSGGNSGADMTTTGPMSTTVAAGGGGYGGSGYGGGGGDGNRCPGQSWGIDCGNGRACCQTPGVGGVPPWCCGLDGGPGGSASDDGGPVATWIAFDSDAQGGTRDIYIVHPDGSGLRRLTVGFSAIEPSFSPDGRQIAFATAKYGVPMQIAVLDLRTDYIVSVTRRTHGARRPAFSPDGGTIAFRSAEVDGNGIGIYAAAIPNWLGEHLVVGTQDTQFVDDEYGGPVYTRDGQWIVYDHYNEIDAIHPDGTGNRVIVPPTTTMQSHPTASPDGLSVALQVMCGDPSGVSSIWAVPSSGITSWACASPARRLSPLPTVPDARHPAWGPDDRVAWDRNGDIFVYGQGQVAAVTSGQSDDRNPTWAPAGAIIP